MEVARDTAVEIDRLVLTLNRTIGAKHGARIRQLAAELGLDSMDMLPHFEDWLMAGRLTRELAKTRLLYRQPESVDSRIDELLDLGLVTSGSHGLAATPRLVPLLEAMLAGRAEAAAAAWSGHKDEVATVLDLGGIVADAASHDHHVAASHRSLPDPSDVYLRLEHRLFTLRYIRQHDHAEAWRSAGLTAQQMVAFTRLWQGEAPGPGEGLQALVAAGLATIDPVALTSEGRTTREQIEAETNRRVQVTFDVLDTAAAAELLGALRRLPSAV